MTESAQRRAPDDRGQTPTVSQVVPLSQSDDGGLTPIVRHVDGRDAQGLISRSPGAGRDNTDAGVAEALGLVIIFPVMLLLAILVVAIGRDIDATAQARSAAQAGAQAAALQRSQGAGDRAMRDVVDRMLDTSTSCVDNVALLTWTLPVGASPGRATVTLSCTRPGTGLERLNRSDQSFTVTAIASIDPLRAIAIDELGLEP